MVLAVVIGAIVFWSMQDQRGRPALGAALDLYSAPLATPGAPAEKNVYTNAADRAKEANREFVAIAKDFGWLPEGTKAHYFAGVTLPGTGPDGLGGKRTEDRRRSLGSDVANLAKIALAGLYHQTGRDAAGHRDLQPGCRQAFHHRSGHGRTA